MARQIEFELNLDDSDFRRGMVRGNLSLKEMINTSRGVTRAFARQDRAAKSLFTTFRDGVVVMGLIRHAFLNLQTATTGWIANIARTSGEFERMTKLLEGLNNAGDGLSAIDKANRDLEGLINLAQNAPFSINQLTDSFVKLRTAGLQDVPRSFKALTDSIASFGGSDDALKRASVAIQQMAGKGVISMEELRQQLGEAIPDAMKIMARSAGVSVGELVKAIETGTVSARENLRNMFLEMERTYGGGAKNLMETFVGTVARLRTQVQLAMREIGEGGLLQSITQAGREISRAISVDNLGKSYRDFGKILGDVVIGIKDFAIVLLDNRETVLTVVKAIGALVAGFITMRVIQGITGMFDFYKQTLLSLIPSMSLTSNGMRAFALSIQLVGVRSTIATASMTALRGALAVVGGPIGLAVTAITLLVTWLFNMKGATEDAVSEIERLGERASAQSVKQLTKSIEEQGKAVEEAAEVFEEARLRRNAFFESNGRNGDGRSLTFFKDALSNLRRQQEEHKKLVKTRQDYNKAVANGTVQALFEKHQDSLISSAKEYRKGIADIEKSGDAASLASRKAVVALANVKDAADLRDAIKLEKAVRSLADNASPELARFFDDFVVKASNATKQVEERMKALKLTDGLKLIDQKVPQLVAEMNRRLGKTKTILDNQKNAAAGVGSEYQKHIEFLKTLRSKSEELTDEQKAQLEELATQARQIDINNDKTEKTEQLMRLAGEATSTITNGLRSAVAEGVRLQRVIAGVFAGLDSSNASKLNKSIEALEKAKQTGAGPGELADLNKIIDAERKQLALNQLTEGVLKGQKELQDAKVNSLKGEARIRAKLKNDIAALEKTLFAGGRTKEAQAEFEKRKSQIQQIAAIEISSANKVAAARGKKGERGRLAEAKREKKNIDDILKLRAQIFNFNKIDVSQLSLKNVSLNQIRATTAKINQLNKDGADFFAGATRKSTLSAIAGLAQENNAFRSSTLTKKELIQQETDARIKHVLASVNLAKLEGEERVKAEQVVRDRINQINEESVAKSKSSFENFLDDSINISEKLEGVLTGAIEGFSSALADAVVDGKADFGDLARSLIKDIIKIGAQAAITGIIKSFVGGLGGNIGSSLGFGSPTGTQGLSLRFHTGGITGTNEGSLPRFHQGGLPTRNGLKDNEVPIIAEEGEGVFTKGQMKALGLMAKGGSRQAAAMPPNVEVNVINQTSQDATSEQQGGRFDGEKYIIDVVMKNANKPGKFRQSIKSVANS